MITNKEHALIGYILATGDFIECNPAAFSDPSAQAAYAVILDVFQSGGTPDYPSCTSHAVASGAMLPPEEDLLDWMAAYAALDRGMTETYSEEIVANWRKSNAIAQIKKALEEAERGGGWDAVTKKIIAAVSETDGHNTMPLANAADGLLSMIDNAPPTLPTGIPAFDKNIGGGLIVGEPNIVAARSGGGKTLFALQMTWNVLKAGGRVLYVLGESTAEMLLARMAFARSGISMAKWLAGGLTPYEKNTVRDAVEAIKREVGDRLVIRVGAINAASIAAQMHGGYDLVVIDHLEHIDYNGGDGKVRGLEDAVEVLRLANKEAHNALLILQQLSVDNDTTTAALRWTKYTLQVAARVVIVEMEEDENDPQNYAKISLYVRKNRYGISNVKVLARVSLSRQWIFTTGQTIKPFMM